MLIPTDYRLIRFFRQDGALMTYKKIYHYTGHLTRKKRKDAV